MSRSELRELLNQPDLIGGPSHVYGQTTFWRYSNVEFHFGRDEDDPLSLIHVLQGDAGVELANTRVVDRLE